MSEIMSIKETASILGINEHHLRMGIEQGLYPFGVAVSSSKGKRKRYLIYKRRFNSWFEGKGIV